MAPAAADVPSPSRPRAASSSPVHRCALASMLVPQDITRLFHPAIPTLLHGHSSSACKLKGLMTTH